MGTRRFQHQRSHLCTAISIHEAPAGRDRQYHAHDRASGVVSIRRELLEGIGIQISTHAPLVGRDSGSRARQAPCGDFNPRTPCGARPPTSAAHPIAAVFQSTCSLRGATFRLRGVARRLMVFQPTRPLWGATASVAACALNHLYFNSRAPCGARRQKLTKIFLRFYDNRQISVDFSVNCRLSERFTPAFQEKMV